MVVSGCSSEDLEGVTMYLTKTTPHETTDGGDAVTGSCCCNLEPSEAFHYFAVAYQEATTQKQQEKVKVCFYN